MTEEAPKRILFLEASGEKKEAIKSTFGALGFLFEMRLQESGTLPTGPELIGLIQEITDTTVFIASIVTILHYLNIGPHNRTKSGSVRIKHRDGTLVTITAEMSERELTQIIRDALGVESKPWWQFRKRP